MLVLSAQALLLKSLPLAAWLVVFAAPNASYILVSEKKGLEARFGGDYRRYRDDVPRWIPRRTPWRGLDRG